MSFSSENICRVTFSITLYGRCVPWKWPAGRGLVVVLGLAGVDQSGLPQTSHQLPEEQDQSHDGRCGNEGESGNCVFQTHRFELATARAVDLKDN